MSFKVSFKDACWLKVASSKSVLHEETLTEEKN